MHKVYKSSQVAEKAQAAAAVLASAAGLGPSLAMVLGTGFHSIVDSVEDAVALPYSSIPGMPGTSVPGHEGRVIVGKLGGTSVVLMSGRAHYYEGHSFEDVTFAIRMLHAYGVRHLLLTNAAGGVNTDYRKGDFMVIRDHINLMGANPLRGVGHGNERFVDLTDAYSPALREVMTEAAETCSLRIHSGVYLAVSGPSYETPAEIRAFALLGADAVGMSTVPEVILARYLGLSVAGLSCITNPAAGLSPEKLHHGDVVETARAASRNAVRLLTTFSTLYGCRQH